MVTIKQIEQGVAAYLDAELMPQLPANGVQKVIAGTAMSILIKRSGEIIESYKDNQFVKMLGIMDSDGNIDVDTLAEELKKNMPKDGMKVDVPIIGELTFKENDVDKLYEYITIL